MQFLNAKMIFSYNNYNPLAEYLPHADVNPVDISPPHPTPDPTPDTFPSLVISPNPAPYLSTLGTLLQRSTRSNYGICTTTRYQDEVLYYLILDP